MNSEFSRALQGRFSGQAVSSLASACLMACGAALVFALLALPARSEHLTRAYFDEQDIVVAGFAMLLVIAGLCWPRAAVHLPAGWLARLLAGVNPGFIAYAAAVMVVLGFAGHFAVMGALAFSRDEQMVLFDAAVFATGRLIGDVPAELRSLLDAMNTVFVIIPPGEANWISSYLPINAMLHTPGSMLGLTALVNPMLAAVGLFATWQVARMLWPDSRENAAVAVLFYLTSTQVWAMSMTSYAMTGHLALNMVWLMCFLRGGRIGHLSAVAVGFAATGLHQVVFHPLFALPFLSLLVLRRQWSLAGFYLGAYMLIGLFWISYLNFTIYAGVEPAANDLGGLEGYIVRLQDLFINAAPHGTALMAANILRFFTWQNLLLLLLPLLIVAFRAVVQSKDEMQMAMFVALLLTPAAMFLLLAYQGHGWGYRYMHGLIGIFCLLAAAGWHHMRESQDVQARALAVATAATVVFVGPYLLWQANSLVRSFAATDGLIGQQKADIVLIDDRTGLAPDLASVWPVRDGRPIRLLSSKVNQARLALLCKRYSVALVSNIGRGRVPMAEQKCP